MDIRHRTFRPPSSGPCSAPGRRTGLLLLAALILMVPAATFAITHALLLRDPKMNAKRFAGYFEDFRYEYHVEVQAADSFLASQRGDCDDYAILADEVLHQRNFSTVLVHVRMAGLIGHAVCYVDQDKAYLDYNNRNVFFTLSHSSSSLREIATKVAKSLEANWTSASVFTYSYETGQKQMIRTIAKTDSPDQDGAKEDSPAARLLVQ